MLGVLIPTVFAFILVTGCRGGAARSTCLRGVCGGTGFTGLDNFYLQGEDTTATPKAPKDRQNTNLSEATLRADQFWWPH